MAMTNAEWMIENKIDLFRLSCKKNTEEKGAFDILLDDRKIARIYASDNTSEMDALLAWLDMRHKGPILDDAEKRYLSAVIRPFRNDVTKISKRGFRPYVFLKFNLKFNGEKYFFLNNCYTVAMFKGMEPNRWYTLEELGL